MQPFQLLSRRNDPERVDFRPDVAELSPSAQLRRLRVYLEQTTNTEADITDCPDGIEAYREYLYRKVFGGTTHEQFLATDATDPQAIDWLIAVDGIATEVYRTAQKTKERY